MRDHKRPAGIRQNSRKLEDWRLSAPTGEGYRNKQKVVTVFSCPKDGHRGNHTTQFEVSYDGVVFRDTDIVRLYLAVDEFHLGLKESDYEKVIILEIPRSFRYNRGKTGGSDEVGIEWSIGWSVGKLGFVFDEARKYKLMDVPVVGSKEVVTENETSRYNVIPWTQERQDAMEALCDGIRQMRERAASFMRNTQGLLEALDGGNANRLLGEGTKV